MTLSVIIPIYNGEQYIRECLDSLLKQEIPAEDYEILCVNDGSRDGSLEILREYEAGYPNVVVIDQENSGVCAAWNAGLNRAWGEFIWFVDGDDLVLGASLGKLREATQDCDRLVFGAYEFPDALTQEEQAQAEAGKLETNTSFYDSVVWRNWLRREFLREHDLTFRYPELTHGEDGVFLYELTLCKPKTVELDTVVYGYRLHAGSAETAKSPESRRRRLKSRIRCCEIFRDYLGRAGSADRLMSFLWGTLYDAAGAPKDVTKEAMAELKKAGLYPFRKPKDCTITNSYMVDKTTLVGKTFDFVYRNLHRPWGYHTMHLLQKLR